MQELTIKNYKGINVTDSREVAQNIGKQHSHLLRDIKGYKEVIDQNPKLDSAMFFIESSYKNDNNQTYPCYLLTKQGCEMVANKLTGEKGILFTAEYVQAFNQMEQAIEELQPQYKLPATYKEALLQLVEAEEEKERLQLANKQQEQIIGELKPKADYTDVILKSNSLVTITQIAKDYGMSGQEMNSLLHELKVQYKLSDQWLLYSKYHNEGYTHSETIPIKHKNGRLEPKMNTKWTQKGRLFLYELLKENGVLPGIEREKEEK